MSKIGRRIGVDTIIPNMGITFYNKLNELTKEFKNAGISLFIKLNEKYDLMNL